MKCNGIKISSNRDDISYMYFKFKRTAESVFLYLPEIKKKKKN